jgi:hypothetical protein
MSRAKPDISKIKQRMSGGKARRESMSVQSQSGSLYVTMMASAWQDAGAQYDDPPEIDQWWLPEEDLLVIDLGDVDDE